MRSILLLIKKSTQLPGQKILVVLFFTSLTIAFCGVNADATTYSGNSGYGFFKIDSVPVNGEVIFDGQSYGNTPALIKIATDSPPFHHVVVKMEGYEDYTQQISYNPESGQTIPISLDATQTMDHIIEFLETQ